MAKPDVGRSSVAPNDSVSRKTDVIGSKDHGGHHKNRKGNRNGGNRVTERETQ